MSDERLAALEGRLRQGFGMFNRYTNEVAARYGPSATVEQRVKVAERVLSGGPLGVLQAMYEHGRRRRREAGLSPPGRPAGVPPGSGADPPGDSR